MRDMSKAAFDAACAKYGFRREGFLGYYQIGHGISVSILNVAPKRRIQLAYLIKCCEREEKKLRAAEAALV